MAAHLALAPRAVNVALRNTHIGAQLRDGGLIPASKNAPAYCNSLVGYLKVGIWPVMPSMLFAGCQCWKQTIVAASEGR
jgi:hypothetical protein